jgi:hypothetical protein
MVRNENQAEGVQNADKPQGSQQRPEKQRPEQQKPEYQGRNRNNNQGGGQGQNHGGIQGNPQVQRVQNQPRQQGVNPSNIAQGQSRREGHILNQSQNQNKSDQGSQAVSQTVSQVQHTQTQPRNNPQNQRSQPERHDGFQKEGGQNKGFYRSRESERDSQPRQRTVQPSGSRYSGPRIRAEETIDDIKEDIIRLEKEIELEMKEIKSLKL